MKKGCLAIFAILLAAALSTSIYDSVVDRAARSSGEAAKPDKPSPAKKPPKAKPAKKAAAKSDRSPSFTAPLSPGLLEAKSLYEDIWKKKDSPSFHYYGFVRAPHRQWHERLKKLQADTETSDALLAKGVAAGDLYIVGKEWMTNKGKDTKASRFHIANWNKAFGLRFGGDQPKFELVSKPSVAKKAAPSKEPKKEKVAPLSKGDQVTITLQSGEKVSGNILALDEREVRLMNDSGVRSFHLKDVIPEDQPRLGYDAKVVAKITAREQKALAEAAARKQTERVLQNFLTKRDEFKGVLYSHHRSEPKHHKTGIYFYVGYKESPPRDPTLWMVATYSGDDWIFAEDITFLTPSGTTHNLHIYNGERDVSSGGSVAEWEHFSMNLNLGTVKAIAQGGTKLRFSGKYKKDVEVSAIEQKMAADALALFQILQNGTKLRFRQIQKGR